jgi:hypothetical protein
VKERFSYYARLSAKDKATYRKSDAIATVAVEDAPSLAPLVRAVDEALATGKRVRVARSLDALSDALLDRLRAPRIRVHVRESRPAIEEGVELHGLYTFATDEAPAKIEVWMRTKAHGRVVRFRTFLRTFLHEIVHHLDVTLLGLSDSFHTEGFFRRESSLMRQLLGAPARKPPAEAPARAAARPKQLKLF